MKHSAKKKKNKAAGLAPGVAKHHVDATSICLHGTMQGMSPEQGQRSLLILYHNA